MKEISWVNSIAVNEIESTIETITTITSLPISGNSIYGELEDRVLVKNLLDLQKLLELQCNQGNIKRDGCELLNTLTIRLLEDSAKVVLEDQFCDYALISVSETEDIKLNGNSTVNGQVLSRSNVLVGGASTVNGIISNFQLPYNGLALANSEPCIELGSIKITGDYQFNQGCFYATEFDISGNGIIEVLGDSTYPTVIFIDGDAKVKGTAQINTNGVAQNLWLIHQGTHVVDYRGNVSMKAIVLAPESSVYLGGNFVLNQGSFLGNDIALSGTPDIYGMGENCSISISEPLKFNF